VAILSPLLQIPVQLFKVRGNPIIPEVKVLFPGETKKAKGKKKKGKAVPLQAWTGPQGSRRSRLPDF
jgi:hypothetical protein